MDVKKRLSVVLFVMGIALMGCSDDSTQKTAPKQIVLNEAESEVARNANILAFDMFCQLYSESSQSVVFSPLSAQLGLAMLANGASGATLEDFKDLMYPGYSLSDLNSYYSKLSSTLPITDGSSKVNIANSLWFADNISLNNDYCQHIADVFGASSNTFRMNDIQGASMRINDWVNKATQGEINMMLSNDDIDAFNLINVFYFKSEWKNKFDKNKTKTDIFYNIDNTKSAVRFMNGEIPIRIGYIEGNPMKGEVAELSFGNDAFCMTFVKPAEGASPLEALEQLRLKGPDFFNCLMVNKVNVRIPRFEAHTKIKLNSALASGGFAHILSDQADYSKISENAVFIKNILQECCIDVDEDGATAAVSTVGSGALLDPGPKYFILDRPFAYMIRETTSGTILFMGAVNRL